MQKDKIVYIVHSIDTEGPLYESLEAKFERIKDLFGIDNLEITSTNLEKLKNKKIDLKGKEENVAAILNSHLSEYNDSWEKIELMIKKIFSKKFRYQMTDSFDNPWIFNWHCLDHVGYKANPRKRDLGYFKIFDKYKKFISENYDYNDRIHWHFHPMSTYNEAHKCASSYVNSPELYQIISRRIIERNWFPVVNRAGFHCERPDSHLFMEQWIPFDLSNMSTEDYSILENSVDFRNGRTGDWRRATTNWEVYQPHHDDYQIPGNCRRWIGRVLNVKNRISSIDQKEMDKAFNQANSGQSALVGVTGHDFRNLGTEVDEVQNFIKNSSIKYPDVKFCFSEASFAFKRMIYGNLKEEKIDLDVEFFNEKGDVPNIRVKTLNGNVFGPQPFLAIKTKSGRFIHDNFDFDLKKGIWHYAFFSATLPITDIEKIGIASNDKYGNTCIKRLNFDGSNKPSLF